MNGALIALYQGCVATGTAWAGLGHPGWLYTSLVCRLGCPAAQHCPSRPRLGGLHWASIRPGQHQTQRPSSLPLQASKAQPKANPPPEAHESAKTPCKKKKPHSRTTHFKANIVRVYLIKSQSNKNRVSTSSIDSKTFKKKRQIFF